MSDETKGAFATFAFIAVILVAGYFVLRWAYRKGGPNKRFRSGR